MVHENTKDLQILYTIDKLGLTFFIFFRKKKTETGFIYFMHKREEK